MKNKLGYIINRLKYKFNYVIANTIMKKKIDKGNNYFNIMDDVTLVNKIIKEKMSLARFGDGELSLILDDGFQISFQSNSNELKKRLKEVLNSNLNNLIIGINRSFNDPSIYNKKVQRMYRAFNYLYREKYKKIIPTGKQYANASITRFYIDYDKNKIEEAYDRVNNLKRIWEKRNILIVEGTQTKLGVGNDLFANCNEIRRIIVPPTNAFEKYNEILKTVKNNVQKNEIILLAIGPTATVLAYDLAKSGIQAIDVGHIDIEYEWMKMKASKRVAIKGKYVNEIKGKKYYDNKEIDYKYNSSIIEKIN